MEKRCVRVRMEESCLGLGEQQVGGGKSCQVVNNSFEITDR